MEEKIIVQSSHYNIRKFTIIFSVIALILSLALYSLAIWRNYNSYAEDYYSDNINSASRCQHMEATRLYDGTIIPPLCKTMEDVRARHLTAQTYVECLGYIYDDMVFYALCFILPAFLIVAIVVFLCLMYSKSSMVITNQRIYGTTAFSNQISLNYGSISAVSSGSMWGVHIGTASKKAKFKLVRNRDEVISAINSLLITKQSETSTPSSLSGAEELGKYKALLDQGVITQEEFDAKKKQLLGL